MNSGEYSLRWNKYHSNLANSLTSFYDKKNFSDVTIQCDGKLFRGHKLVLAACSPFFEKVFKDHFYENQIVHLHDVSADCVENIMEYMYTGSTQLGTHNVKAFFELGAILKLKGLSSSAVSGEELPVEQQPEQDNEPNDEGESSTLISTLAGFVPSVGCEFEDERHVSVSSGVINVSPLAPPEGVPTQMGRNNAVVNLQRGPRSNAMEYVEALMAIDNNSSSGDGFVSGSPTPPFNQTRPHNSVRPVKRVRPTCSISIETMQRNMRARTFPSTAPSMLAGLAGYEQPIANYESGESSSSRSEGPSDARQLIPIDVHIAPNDEQRMGPGHMDIPAVAPGEKWFQGRLQFMLSQRGKPLLVHDGHSFGIQYIRKDKKYWQCNLSRKYNCKARVTTTDTGDIIVTNNEHCHTEIRQHLRKDYKTMKLAASLAANRASFAVSLAMPSQSNPSIECSSTTSPTDPTIVESDIRSISAGSGRLPEAEQEIMNLTRIEQV